MNKQDYENVIMQVEVTIIENHEINTLLNTEADVADETVEAKVVEIHNNLNYIKAWAQQEIEKINNEAVINSFIGELKAVFDKYDGKLEIVSEDGQGGYGLNYGEGTSTTSVGVRFTATLDGVTASRDILKGLVVAEDLV